MATTSVHQIQYTSLPRTIDKVYRVTFGVYNILENEPDDDERGIEYAIKTYRIGLHDVFTLFIPFLFDRLDKKCENNTSLLLLPVKGLLHLINYILKCIKYIVGAVIFILGSLLTMLIVQPIIYLRYRSAINQLLAKPISSDNTQHTILKTLLEEYNIDIDMIAITENHELVVMPKYTVNQPQKKLCGLTIDESEVQIMKLFGVEY